VKISNTVAAVGFLLMLVLVFGALIPFEPRWFNVTMTSASHESEETEVDYVAVADIQWSPDGERVLTRSNGSLLGSGALSFCDLAPGATARPRWSGIRDTSHAILSSDGSTAFFSAYQGHVFCMQLNSAEIQKSKIQTLIKLPAGEWIYALAAAPDGRLLALGSGRGTILLTDAEGVESGRLYRDDHGSVSCVTFSADGRRLVSTSPFRSIVVWDVAQRLQLQEFTGHDGSASEAVFLDGGRQVLSCGLDGTLRQWDVASGTEVWRGGVPGDPPISSLTVDPREKLAVTAHDDGRIAFWDLIDAELLDDLPAHARLVGRVRFSPDGMSLASAGLDGMIRIWDVASRSVKTEIDLSQAQ
jgi:WD40 repeat protein